MNLGARWLMVACLAAMACGRGGPTVPDPPPIPDGLEPAVQRQLTSARDKVLTSEPGPARVEAWGAFGRTAHAYRLSETASVAYNAAASLAPEDFRWAYYLGRLRLAANEPGAALDPLRRAVALRPADRIAQVALGEALLATGEIEAARRLFREAARADSRDGRARFGLGRAALAAGDPRAAVEALERLLALQPKATRVHGLLADAWRALGDLDQAQAHLALRGDGPVVSEDYWMAAVEAERRGGRLAVQAGTDAFAAGRFDEAEAAFEKAIEEDPTDAVAWVNLGAALVQLGRWDEAENAFMESLQHDPGQARPHFNLGALQGSRGLEGEAIEHYEAAIRIDPEYANAHFNLASTALRQGNARRAAEEFDWVLDREPGREDARLGEAVSLSALGRDVEALSRLEEGLGMRPESAVLRNGLARILAASPTAGARDGVRAVELARGLIAAQSALEHVETLAMALAENEDWEGAVHWQERAVEAVRPTGQKELLTILQANLERYRRREPCRQPWPLPSQG